GPRPPRQRPPAPGPPLPPTHAERAQRPGAARGGILPAPDEGIDPGEEMAAPANGVRLSRGRGIVPGQAGQGTTRVGKAPRKAIRPQRFLRRSRGRRVGDALRVGVARREAKVAAAPWLPEVR